MNSKQFHLIDGSRKALVVTIWALWFCCQAMSQESNPKPQRPAATAIVSEYEALEYPSLAQYVPQKVEGIVVLHTNLDESGRVVDVQALSGSKYLLVDAIANVKKWLFHPQSGRSAIVVYNFRKLEGDCKARSSLFSVDEYNFVDVIGCWPELHSSIEVNAANYAMTIKDSEVRVRKAEEVNYPAIAEANRIHGIVVLEAKIGNTGSVEEVIMLAGNPLLAKACTDNIRKWQFEPNSHMAVVMVYRFRLSGSTFFGSTSRSQFQPPNLITVEAAPVNVIADK